MFAFLNDAINYHTYHTKTSNFIMWVAGLDPSICFSNAVSKAKFKDKMSIKIETYGFKILANTRGNFFATFSLNS